jgi:hypothetical protein
MEICKNLCIEPAPFDYQSNYIISWMVDPAIYDLGSSYINIPMQINETYPAPVRGGSYVGAVSNVSLGAGTNSATSLSTANIKSIRLKLDGQEVVYTPDINRLLGSLDIFDYNVAEERLQEYFSGNTQTYPAGLQAGSVLNYSVFRELFNEGVNPSLKFNPTIKVPLKKLLGGLADEVRDLRNYKSIEIICELDNNTLFVNPIEEVPKFGGPTHVGALNNLGWGTDVAGAQSGASAWTSTNDFTVANFPWGVGDTVSFTVTADCVIQTATVAGGKMVLTLDKNIAAGDVALLGTSVSTFKQFKLVGALVNDLQVKFPIGNSVAFLQNGVPINVNAPFPTVVAYVQELLDVKVLISNVIGVQINANAMSVPPLLLNYTLAPGNTNPIPDNIPTVGNFSNLTFPLWVGQPVLVGATSNVDPISTVISKIDYNAGKARLTFSPKVTATGGGNVAGLYVIPQMAESLATVYPERWELVQYRMLNMGQNLDKSLFNATYKKWRFDADTIPEMPTYGIYEKTFLLEPLTACVVVCLCQQNGLTSEIGNLASYRLRIDGVDSTSREILLNGDPSYKYERLLNGFQYLSENLGAITTNPAQNQLSRDSNRYVILQDLVVDGKEHKLTVSLVNGSTSIYSTRNIRIYKNIISQLP